MVQGQVLNPWSTVFGILNCAYWVQTIKNKDLAVDLATAANQWQEVSNDVPKLISYLSNQP